MNEKLREAVDRLVDLSNDADMSVACRVAIFDLRDIVYEHPAVRKLEQALKTLERGWTTR